MSLLDQLSSQVSAALGGAAGQHPGLLGHVVDLVNNPATGGLAGLVQAFHDHGLGGVVTSCVGRGGQEGQGAAGDPGRPVQGRLAGIAIAPHQAGDPPPNQRMQLPGAERSGNGP